MVAGSEAGRSNRMRYRVSATIWSLLLRACRLDELTVRLVLISVLQEAGAMMGSKERVFIPLCNRGSVAAEWAVHCRPEMSREGVDDALHPVRWREDTGGWADPPGRAALALQRVSPPVHRPLRQRIFWAGLRRRHDRAGRPLVRPLS